MIRLILRIDVIKRISKNNETDFFVTFFFIYLIVNLSFVTPDISSVVNSMP